MARHTTKPVAGFCKHHRPLDLGYLAWHAEADRRYKARLKQMECTSCGRWLWPDEVGEKPPARPRLRVVRAAIKDGEADAV